MRGMSQTRQTGESRGRGVTGMRLAVEAEREEATSSSSGGKDDGYIHFLGLLLEST